MAAKVSKVLCLLAGYSIMLLQGDDRSSNIPNCLSQLQCQRPWLLASLCIYDLLNRPPSAWPVALSAAA